MALRLGLYCPRAPEAPRGEVIPVTDEEYRRAVRNTRILLLASIAMTTLAIYLLARFAGG